MVKLSNNINKKNEDITLSSEMLSAIYELNPDAITISNVSNGKIIDCNQKYLNQIGYTREEVIGHTSKELKVYTNHKERETYTNEILKKKTIDNLELQLKRKDNSFIDVLCSARLINLDNKQFILTILQNITEQKKIEEQKQELTEKLQTSNEEHQLQIDHITYINQKLKISEDKYYSLYSSMNEGVALHEITYNSRYKAEDYVIVDINPAYESILGLKRTDVVGMKASELYGTGSPPYMEIYVNVAEKGEPTEFETFFEPMDKYFRISVISPGKGKFATIFEDITKRKNTEKQRQELLEKEQQFTEELQVTNEELKSTTEELQVSNEKLQRQIEYTLNINQKLKESEERFRDLADNIPNLAWMAYSNGWRFWYNKQWYEYTGTTLEEMQGWGWQKVHHPNFVKSVTEDWLKKIKEEKPYDNTFPLKSKDGTYHWFLTRVTPIRNEKGKLIRWFGTNTDITERKVLEEKLLFQSNILSRVQEGIIAVDENFRIIYWNNMAEKMLGWSEKEILGRNSGELLQTKIENSNRENLIETLLNEGHFVGEVYYMGKDKTYLPVEVNVKTSTNEKGELTGTLTTFRDITRRKQNEEKLKGTMDELKKSNKELEQFAYITSHDLARTIKNDNKLFTIIRTTV